MDRAILSDHPSQSFGQWCLGVYRGDTAMDPAFVHTTLIHFEYQLLAGLCSRL